jgi:hypothetical protein
VPTDFRNSCVGGPGIAENTLALDGCGAPLAAEIASDLEMRACWVATGSEVCQGTTRKPSVEAKRSPEAALDAPGTSRRTHLKVPTLGTRLYAVVNVRPPIVDTRWAAPADCSRTR